MQCVPPMLLRQAFLRLKSGPARLAHQAFKRHPDDQQVVPICSDVAGTHCCAPEAATKRNHRVFMSQS